MNTTEAVLVDEKLVGFLNKVIKIYENPEYKHFYPTGVARSDIAKMIMDTANIAGKNLLDAKKAWAPKSEIKRKDLIFLAYRSPKEVLDNLKTYSVEDKKAVVAHFELIDFNSCKAQKIGHRCPLKGLINQQHIR